MNPEKTAEIIELIVDTIAVAAFFICVEIIRRILFSKKPVEVTLPDPVVIPESIKEVEAAVSNELIESSKRVYLYKAFCT